MSHFITYLALEEAAVVDAEALAERYRSLYGEDAYAMQTVATADPGMPGGAFVVMMDQMPVTVMFIDKPLPADAYEQALSLDVVGPEARETMAGHKAHVIVSLVNDPQDHLDNLNGAASVTLVAGALASLLPTVALVSTEGCVIMKPDTFGPLAAGLARHEIPVAFWSAMAFVGGRQDADGREIMRAVTYGLTPFIGREVECFTITAPATAVAEWLINLSHFLVRNGPVINDTETVSLTPEEKVRAAYRAEGTRPGVPVIEFDLDNIVAPEGKPAPVAEAAPQHAVEQPRGPSPEPMPVQDYGGTFDAPARRQAAVFGKRGSFNPAAVAASVAPQTKSPARWPGLRLFARK